MKLKGRRSRRGIRQHRRQLANRRHANVRRAHIVVCRVFSYLYAWWKIGEILSDHMEQRAVEMQLFQIKKRTEPVWDPRYREFVTYKTIGPWSIE